MKLVTDEPGSREARKTIKRYLKDGYSLYTVDIALAESLNAIWKHTRIHRDLEIEEAKSAIQDLTKIYDAINILETRELSNEAAEISLTKGITIYDSLYIAAAMKLKATLYTADQKLCSISKELVVSNLLKPHQ
ncbi:type II toxin-antitoxin system VapC family toxin [Candidatus Bathyarchaeota archaeon]|nr:type II toxin-antitoxin system VapC family toxin [Candidatus Bathyarchaeota archaeon]